MEIQNKFMDIYRNTEQIYGHLQKYRTNLRTFTEIRNKFTDIYGNTEQITSPHWFNTGSDLFRISVNV